MSVSALPCLSARSRVISTETTCAGGRRVSAVSQQSGKPRTLPRNHNYRIKEERMKSFGWTVMSALAVFLATTSTGWAQTATPTPTAPPIRILTAASAPTDCAGGSIGSCVGDLLDEEDSMIDQVELMLKDLETMGLFSLARDRFSLAADGPDLSDLFARIDTLRNEHRRAKAASEATTDSEYDEMFEQADKEKGKNCKFSDINFFNSVLDASGDPDPALLGLKTIPMPSKFGNGKCDIFDAVDLGDNPVRVNERKENMCEKVCAEKPNQQGKSKDRAIGGFIDALSSARAANISLVAQRASMAELGSLLLDLQLSESNPQLSAHDPCAPGSPGPGDDLLQARGFNKAIAVLGGVITVGNVLSEVLKTAADIADKPCKQTAGGFNASVACIPFTVAFHISKGIVGIISGVRTLLGDLRSVFANEAKIVSAGKIDKGKACSKIIRDDTIKLKAEFGGGQCVNLVCTGGPDDSIACTDDSDCSEGKIVILQEAVNLLRASAAQTNAKLAEVTAELALMKSLLEETRDLLLTPPGRRPGYKPKP